MKRVLCVVLAYLLGSGVPLAAAARDDRATYLGGTVTAIQEKQQGILDTSDASTLVFRWEKDKWEVPFTSITKIVYRKKVGRHVAATVATTAAVGVGGLFVLLAKKKKHFLSLELNNGPGQVQIVVFELSKDSFEGVIADLEEKTGLRLEVEVEESARRNKRTVEVFR
jgi:hypothetical protein